MITMSEIRKYVTEDFGQNVRIEFVHGVDQNSNEIPRFIDVECVSRESAVELSERLLGLAKYYPRCDDPSKPTVVHCINPYENIDFDYLRARTKTGLLIVKNAWTIPALPMSIVIELPGGEMMIFDVRQRAGAPMDDELRPYMGYHPDNQEKAERLTGQRLAVYGLALQKQAGTRPDTSLYLGEERKAWLAEQGGIQPTIQQLIDEAMQYR